MTGATAWAVTFTAREKAEFLPVERDESSLGPTEIAGPTMATLVSAGTELEGAYLGTQFPRTPGYAAIFRVEQTGNEVAGFPVGSLAYCMGPHRSFQRTTVDRALPVPAGLDPHDATFARLLGVSMSTLVTTTARPGDGVLVTGQGLVGHLAALVFARCGYSVVASDPSAVRREFSAGSGIRVLPAVPLGDPEFQDRTALVIECSGHEQAALDGCRLVRKKGEVVLIGAPWRRRSDALAHDLLHAIFHRYVVLRSGWEWELPLKETDFRSGAIFRNYSTALRWLAEGAISVTPLYEAVKPEHAQQAFQDLLHVRTRRLAVVFDWRPWAG